MRYENMLRRYMVFSGATCYPLGGMADFKGSFDVPTVAIAIADKCIEEENYETPFEPSHVHTDGFAWAHVYDTEKHTIIYETGGVDKIRTEDLTPHDGPETFNQPTGG